MRVTTAVCCKYRVLPTGTQYWLAGWRTALITGIPQEKQLPVEETFITLLQRNSSQSARSFKAHGREYRPVCNKDTLATSVLIR